MNLRSCIYVGSVMHRRLRPRAHNFRYRAFWLLIDLDELPSLSSGLQAKILKALEDNRIRRVGGTREISVDARIIAASFAGILGPALGFAVVP